MSAEHVRDEAMVAWVLGEMVSTESERVSEHLVRCDRCREGAEALRAAVAVLARERPGDAPGAVLASLLEAQAERRSPRPARSPAIPALVAAAALAAFAFGFWTGRRSAGPVPAEVAPAGQPVTARTPLPPPPRIPFASS